MTGEADCMLTEKDVVLGCCIQIALPDGEFDKTWADFDTRSSADVVALIMLENSRNWDCLGEIMEVSSR